ncbi:methyl-accepting chemotaxis protein [Novispirillum itersonii]|uniref:methyl-accepting chemotaxis protein n=1 Tax=Novispirillum itersonii TaxID=189 RepID=UPI00036AE2DF|nr:PAS domain-containing methyl-accepting chemotaxis protein [Novispirillum itersonii]
MFWSRASSQAEEVLHALNRSQAVIEFALDGTILNANQPFLILMEYSAEELIGKNHRLLVDEQTRTSPDYDAFWNDLRRGEFKSAQFKRITKSGRTVWLRASYNPVQHADGTLHKIVKYASDVTQTKEEHIDLLGKVNAILRSQAVIEFQPDGTVITANENFLGLLGYRLDEIVGQHHRMFVDPAEQNSPGYATFWDDLRQGEFRAAQYKRLTRSGQPVWIQANYNPVFDLDGRLVKIVKFATDVTEQVLLLDQVRSMLTVNFSEIDGAINQSDTLAHTAGSAAAETLGNVRSIAAGAQDLAASVHTISASMSRSQEASDTAAAVVADAGSAVERLSEATYAMSGIVSTIQNIAAQINLLALNATIESARAGDAGKGFAVVAGEVKALATQAARSTSQISHEIEGVQKVADDVVGALDSIRQSIGTVRGHVVSTASAVKEQNAVTRSMSQTMESAARAVEQVSGNVLTISEAIGQARGAFDRTREAAEVLARR